MHNFSNIEITESNEIWYEKNNCCVFLSEEKENVFDLQLIFDEKELSIYKNLCENINYATKHGIKLTTNLFDTNLTICYSFNSMLACSPRIKNNNKSFYIFNLKLWRLVIFT
jgi:hypothetical protein